MTDYVTVYVKVIGEPSEEDEAVPGVYAVSVDEALEDEDKASCALEVFHEHVNIEEPDDFVISVHAEDGSELGAGELVTNTLSARGSFIGQVSEDELPEALQET
jgi:hypothetical protein